MRCGSETESAASYVAHHMRRQKRTSSHGAKAGLGIEENIVTLCRECHRRFDQTTDRENIAEFVRAYLAKKYPEWDETKLYYRKGNA